MSNNDTEIIIKALISGLENGFGGSNSKVKTKARQSNETKEYYNPCKTPFKPL